MVGQKKRFVDVTFSQFSDRLMVNIMGRLTDKEMVC